MLYTIGHSNRKIDDFIKILKKNNIKIVIDIRWNLNDGVIKFYKQENLIKILAENGIHYRHFEKEFIPKHLNLKELLKVDCIDNLVERREFRFGVKKLKTGIEKGYNIVLLCREKNPERCHRFYYVAYGFYRNDVNAIHIVEMDKNISTTELIRRVEEEELIKTEYKYLYKQRPLQLIFRDMFIEKLTNIKSVLY